VARGSTSRSGTVWGVGGLHPLFGIIDSLLPGLSVATLGDCLLCVTGVDSTLCVAAWPMVVRDLLMDSLMDSLVLNNGFLRFNGFLKESILKESLKVRNLLFKESLLLRNLLLSRFLSDE